MLPMRAYDHTVAREPTLHTLPQEHVLAVASFMVAQRLIYSLYALVLVAKLRILDHDVEEHRLTLMG
jgi:hypothetical protein